MLIYGINPVLEALRAGRVKALRVSDRGDERLRRILDEAARQQVPVERADSARLAREARHGVHQGVVAEDEAGETLRATDLLRNLPAPALIVVLDGIEDPHRSEEHTSEL